jgi:hypothetical protein
MKSDEIRGGLHNIRTRAATIDAVTVAGEAMIETILPLLQDRNEGVRWSAIRILSEIGDARATGPLIALIQQNKNPTDAANALCAITGQDLGSDAAAWQRWANDGTEAPAPVADNALSDGALIAAAVQDLPLTLRGEGQEYCVDVSLADGRSHQVTIDLSREDPNGRAIVQLSTPCGDADPARYEDALKLNMSIPYGAIAVASLGDSLCFAMVDSYLRASVHPEDIAESIMSLARHGDSLEQSLTGEDRY